METPTHQRFGSAEHRALHKLAQHLGDGTGIDYCASVKGLRGDRLSFFADVGWLTDRNVLFKTFIVEEEAAESEIGNQDTGVALGVLRLPTAGSAQLGSRGLNILRRTFAHFEATAQQPRLTDAGFFVFTCDRDVRKSNCVRLSLPLRPEDVRTAVDSQLDAISLNISLQRLGCCSATMTLSADPPSEAVREKFRQLMGFSNISSSNIGDYVRTLVKVIQRNLRLLGLYPLNHAATTSIDDDFWFDGVICDTTRRGMTEFVSALIQALVKTAILFRQNLALLGFVPIAVPTTSNSLGALQFADWRDFERCIKEFQKAAGLRINGVLDETTRAKLNSLVRDSGSKVTDGGANLETNQLLLLGQQTMRGIRGSGIESSDAGGMSSTGNSKRRLKDFPNPEELTIPFYVDVAKRVEEVHDAVDASNRAKMERLQAGSKPRDLMKKRNISPSRVVSTTAAPAKREIKSRKTVEYISGSGIVMSSNRAASPQPATERVPSNASAIATPDLIQNISSKASSASLSLKQPKAPNSRLSPLMPTSSVNSLNSRQQSHRGQGNEEFSRHGFGEQDHEVEEGTLPVLGNQSGGHGIPRQKIIEGIKNIGRNVKRLGNTVVAVVGARRGSIESAHGLPYGVEIIHAKSDEQHKSEELYRRHRSLSVGDVSVRISHRSASVHSFRENGADQLLFGILPSSLKRSMSETGLSTMRGVGLGIPRSKHSSQLVFSALTDPHLITPRKKSADVEHLADEPSARVKSDDGFENEQDLTEAEAAETQDKKFATAPELAVSITNRLNSLLSNPNASTLKLSPKSLSEIEILNETCARISTIVKPANDTSIGRESGVSILDLEKLTADAKNRIVVNVSTRVAHKEQLSENLRKLGSDQKIALEQIDSLYTMNMKLKYAIGLLDGRVAETEEGVRAFSTRVDGIDEELRKVKGDSGGIVAWLKDLVLRK
ncbi:hypothetical protein HDU82_000555 [Entophlyctis luteolus]|nr:hypothetical protein HDU82_000555 [Entophlyctis luteolus]